ncbi:hypothetical protein AOLI_G00058920 [Acnodon oligacanthus]
MKALVLQGVVKHKQRLAVVASHQATDQSSQSDLTTQHVLQLQASLPLSLLNIPLIVPHKHTGMERAQNTTLREVGGVPSDEELQLPVQITRLSKNADGSCNCSAANSLNTALKGLGPKCKSYTVHPAVFGL